jgi:hypothetical protein
LIEKILVFLRVFVETVRQATIGPAKSAQNLARVQEVEEIDRRTVFALNQTDLQVRHEPGRGHPEIIPHHDDALHAAAVALPQSLHQLRRAVPTTGMKPLFKLVNHDEELLVARVFNLPERTTGRLKAWPTMGLSAAESGQGIFQAGARRQIDVLLQRLQ